VAKGLTPKERLFALEYLVDLNATQAAIRAGYSKKTAGAIGHENLKKPEIKEFLDEQIAKREKRVEVTADRVLAELMRVGFSDLRRAFNEDGSLKAPKDWPDDVAAAMSSVEVVEEFEGKGEDRQQVGWTKKVKLWDKPRALEMLGKHLKLFAERVEHSGPSGGPIEFRDGLSDAERMARLVALFDSARARDAGRGAGGAEEVEPASGAADKGARE
jgi:phage terminase small subunit